MLKFINKRNGSAAAWFCRGISSFVAVAFILTLVIPPGSLQAQTFPQTMLNLPVPGTMVPLSGEFSPTIVKGLTIHPDNPLEFNFIVDTGDEELDDEEFKVESEKLIKYFLAALTVPEEQMWVNLSPYEQERIVPDGLGVTELGRDLLTQDYLLKQLTASLIYPEDELGKKFWEKIRRMAFERYGTIDIPVNTFNKVWIVPDKAVVYEYEGTVFVVERHLKVMLEEDYKALKSNLTSPELGMEGLGVPKARALSETASEVVREVIIPELEREVNEGKNFAKLRQIYNSMILATWFKKNLRDGLIGRVYVDQNKIKGVDIADKDTKQKIYDQYIEAFKRGVYNYIKEDYDPASQQLIPRKYFSGGLVGVDQAMLVKLEGPPSEQDPALLARLAEGNHRRVEVILGEKPVDPSASEASGIPEDKAMAGKKDDSVNPKPSRVKRDQEDEAMAGVNRFNFQELVARGYTTYQAGGRRFLFVKRKTSAHLPLVPSMVMLDVVEVKESGRKEGVAFLDFSLEKAGFAELNGESVLAPPLPETLGIDKVIPIALREETKGLGFYIREGYRNQRSEGVWNLDKLMMRIALETARLEGMRSLRIVPDPENPGIRRYYQNRYGAEEIEGSSHLHLSLDGRLADSEYVSAVYQDGEPQYFLVQDGPNAPSADSAEDEVMAGKMQDVKVVVWDWDRTIWDVGDLWEKMQARIIARIWSEEGKTGEVEDYLESAARFYHNTQGVTDKERFELAIRARGLPDQPDQRRMEPTIADLQKLPAVENSDSLAETYAREYYDAQDRYIAEHIDHWRESLQDFLVNGALEAVDEFHRRGLTQYILTANHYLTVRLLEQLGLNRYFKDVFGVGSWSFPESFTKKTAIAKIMQANPGTNAVVIGDGAGELTAAREVSNELTEAGTESRIFTVGLTYPENASQLQQLNPDMLFQESFPRSYEFARQLNLSRDFRFAPLSEAPFKIEEITDYFLDMENVITDTINLNREHVSFIYAMIVNGVKDPDNFVPSVKDLLAGRDFYEAHLGGSTKDNLRELLENLSRQGELKFKDDVEALHSYFVDLYAERRDSELKKILSLPTAELRQRVLMPGVMEFLRVQEKRGVMLRIVSAAEPGAKTQIFERLRLEEYFEEIIFTGSKADKLQRIFDAMAAEGIDGEKTVFVDDAPNVVRDARKLIAESGKSFWIVGMPYTVTHAEQMQGHADYLVADLSGLIGGRQTDDLLSQPIDILQLSARAGNVLANAEIKTIGQLVQKIERDVLVISGLGRGSLDEVKETLARLGLKLGTFGEITEDSPIEALGLRIRAENALKRKGILTVGQLIREKGRDLTQLPNFDRSSLEETQARLEEHGFKLGTWREVTAESPIQALGLSTRVEMILKRRGILTIRDLIGERERSFGQATLAEIKAKLAQHGFELGEVSPLDISSSIQYLNLPARTEIALRNANIHTIGELLARRQKRPVMVANLGKKGWQAIEKKLLEHGFIPESGDVSGEATDGSAVVKDDGAMVGGYLENVPHAVETLRDRDLIGKKVLVRVNTNVPISATGEVTDITRITEMVPVTRFLLDRNATVILYGHNGRFDPDLDEDDRQSVAPIKAELERLLVGVDVTFHQGSIDEDGLHVTKMDLNAPGVHILENVRFAPSHENGPRDSEERIAFARGLAALSDGIFIFDAFGDIGSKGASVEDVPFYADEVYVGPGTVREFYVLRKIQEGFDALVFGGKKLDKVDLLEGLVARSLRPGGFAIIGSGPSVELNDNRADFLAALRRDDSQRVLTAVDYKDPGNTFDIGPETLRQYLARLDTLQAGQSVLLNGTMGNMEHESGAYKAGTKDVLHKLKELAQRGVHIVVVGGNASETAREYGLEKEENMVFFTGGGVPLKILAGEKLVGADALRAAIAKTGGDAALVSRNSTRSDAFPEDGKVGATVSSQGSETVGGIDLDAAKLDLQIKRDGRGVPLPLPEQPIEDINIEGFYPIIINVAPVSVPMLLGLTDSETPALARQEG